MVCLRNYVAHDGGLGTRKDGAPKKLATGKMVRLRNFVAQ